MSLSNAEKIRRKSGEQILKWMEESEKGLEEMKQKAESVDHHLKIFEAAGKLAERLAKFAELESDEDKTSKPRKTVVEVVRRDRGLGEY